MFYSFLLRTGHCEYYTGVTGNLISHSSRTVSFACSGLKSSVLWPFQTIFASAYLFDCLFLAVCDHWSSCYNISAVSQWPNTDFLKCLAPKRGVERESTDSLNLLADAAAQSLCSSGAETKANTCVHPSGICQIGLKKQLQLSGGQGAHCLPTLASASQYRNLGHYPHRPRGWGVTVCCVQSGPRAWNSWFWPPVPATLVVERPTPELPTLLFWAISFLPFKKVYFSWSFLGGAALSLLFCSTRVWERELVAWKGLAVQKQQLSTAWHPRDFSTNYFLYTDSFSFISDSSQYFLT